MTSHLKETLLEAVVGAGVSLIITLALIDHYSRSSPSPKPLTPMRVLPQEYAWAQMDAQRAKLYDNGREDWLRDCVIQAGRFDLCTSQQGDIR